MDVESAHERTKAPTKGKGTRKKFVLSWALSANGRLKFRLSWGLSTSIFLVSVVLAPLEKDLYALPQHAGQEEC